MLDVLRSGDVKLLRCSWLMERAGYREETVQKGRHHVRLWFQRDSARPLPRRQELEAEEPAAFLTVEEIERLIGAFGDLHGAYATTELGSPLPIIAVSHCWERGDHPDPEGRTLSTIAQMLAGGWIAGTLQSGMPLFRAWGFDEMGVFLDWGSLVQGDHAKVQAALDSGLSVDDAYKLYRSPEEAAIFKRSLESMSLWYAHQQTTVLQVCITSRRYHAAA